MATIKQYNLAGLNANVELGKNGSYIVGGANTIGLYNANDQLQKVSIANAVTSNQAVTLAQLNSLAEDLVQHITVDVTHTSGTANIVTIPTGSRIRSVTVEVDAAWTGANAATSFIEVGDTGNGSRFIRSQDVDVTKVAQYHSQYQYEYLNEGTLTYSVTQGSATAGNAIISVVLTADYLLDTDTDTVVIDTFVSSANILNEGGNITFTVTTINESNQTLRFRVLSNSDVIGSTELAANSSNFGSIGGTNPFNNYVNFSLISDIGNIVVPTVNNNVVTSGETWTIVDSPEIAQWVSVAYGDGVWVAVAAGGVNNRVMRSTNGGATWTAVVSAAAADYDWASVAYGDGVWVAVAASGVSTNQVMRSTDGGVTWTGVAAAEPNTWVSVAYGNGVWVAVAQDGTNRVMRSTDGGVTWTAVAAAERLSGVPMDLVSVAYGNGVWIAVDGGLTWEYPGHGILTNRVMRSTDDGVTWTALPGDDFFSAEGPGWASVAYGDGVWVAVLVGTGITNIRRSTDDGLTWASPVNFTPDMRQVVYGDGVWIALDNEFRHFARSIDDGLNWTQGSFPGDGVSFYGVAYGDGVWIAVCPTGSDVVVRSIGDIRKFYVEVVGLDSDTVLATSNVLTIVDANTTISS